MINCIGVVLGGTSNIDPGYTPVTHPLHTRYTRATHRGPTSKMATSQSMSLVNVLIAGTRQECRKSVGIEGENMKNKRQDDHRRLQVDLLPIGLRLFPVLFVNRK